MNFLQRLPLHENKLDESSRLDVVEIASFRTCFLPGRAKDLSVPAMRSHILTRKEILDSILAKWHVSKQNVVSFMSVNVGQVLIHNLMCG